MRYLIDTHVLIWFAEASPKLKVSAKRVIQDGENEIFVSYASIWEMAIKSSIGKLTLIQKLSKFEELLKINDFQILPFSFGHFETLEKLPHFHQDPFDRIIISQAMFEKMTVITHDGKFSAYAMSLYLC